MMNRRPLNSDQLGKKGEARFQELCVDAGLVPNPASWDRRGWDYIVQWPHMDTDVSLDVRPAPLACFVQNKTLWTGNGSIKAPLSSLEHIAKDPKPAFIYVLEVDNELRFTGAHALHIEGGLLGLILERLRRAQIEGDPPNRIEVKLNLGRWGRPIEPTGAAFRAFAEDAIGPSLQDCMERKLRELRTLGFEKGRLTLRTTFQGHTVDQITDAFLGVGRLEVVRAEAAETRFGMEVPLPALDFGPGEMELSPKAKDKCTVTIRRSGGLPALRFRGKMYSLPSWLLPPGSMKVLIRGELLDIMVRADKPNCAKPGISMKLSMEPDRVGQAWLTTAEWRDFYEFMQALFSETMEIEMQPSKLDRPLSGTISVETGPAITQEWRYAVDLTRMAAEILDRAGWPGTRMGISDLADVGREIKVLYEMMHGGSELTPLSFETGTEAEAMLVAPFEMLYVGCISLGKHAIAYGASCTLAGTRAEDKIKWTGNQFRVREVDRIKPTQKALDGFASGVRRRTGILSHFAPSLSPDTEAEPSVSPLDPAAGTMKRPST